MRKLTLLTAICFIVLSGAGFAKDPDFGKLKLPRGKWWRIPEISEKLNLTSEKQAKLDELYTQNRRKLIDLKSNVERKGFDLEQIVEKESFNESAAMDQLKKLEDARTNLATERFRFLIEVRKLLGTERYQQLKIIHKDYRKKGDKKRKK